MGFASSPTDPEEAGPNGGTAAEPRVMGVESSAPTAACFASAIRIACSRSTWFSTARTWESSAPSTCPGRTSVRKFARNVTTRSRPRIVATAATWPLRARWRL